MSNNKVVRFKKRKSINIGVIVFLILFLYIALNVYFYFTKEHLSIYEVHEGSSMIDNQITGLILRSETVVNSEKAGYISYYQKEGARVAKNATVYSVDDNGTMNDILAAGDLPVKLSSKNSAEFKRNMKEFRNSYSDQNYKSVYDFKEEAKSTVLDMLTNAMIDNEKALKRETGQSLSNNMIPSKKSGIISYYTDGFEAVTPDKVTPDMFKLDKYNKTGLRTTDIIDLNKPIYKLITSEEWKLVLPLTKEQYDCLAGKDQVTFSILEDEIKITAAVTLSQINTQYYAILTMNKYLSNYLEERYLDVELNFDSTEGLKIPRTSIVEKDFYLVPKEYECMGADSTDIGFTIEDYDEKSGEASFNFTHTDIYYEDDAYAYIDADQFAPGTYIHSASGKGRYTLGPTNKLTGVYNVNQGYAVFRRIEILSQNKEYCIVSDKTKYGLSAYDQIALVGKTAIDQGIISKH